MQHDSRRGERSLQYTELLLCRSSVRDRWRWLAQRDSTYLDSTALLSGLCAMFMSVRLFARPGLTSCSGSCVWWPPLLACFCVPSFNLFPPVKLWSVMRVFLWVAAYLWCCDLLTFSPRPLLLIYRFLLLSWCNAFAYKHLFFPVSSFCLLHSVLVLYFLRCKPCDHNFAFKFIYPLFIFSLFPLNCLSFFVLITFYRCYVFRQRHKYTNTSDYVHVYRVAHDNPLPP